jgi:hypothetical protein
MRSDKDLKELRHILMHQPWEEFGISTRGLIGIAG